MSPQFDLIVLLGISTSGISFFLMCFYLFRTIFKNDGYLFLYFAIGILGYEVFYKTLIHSRLVYEFVLLYTPGRFLNLIIYPVFLLFVLGVTRKGFKLKTPHYLMLLFFVGYSLLIYGKAMVIPMEEKLNMLDLFYEDRRPGPFNYWANARTLVKFTIIPVLMLGIIGLEYFNFRRKNATLQRTRLLHFLTLIIALYFLYNQFANWIYQVAYQVSGYSMVEWPVDILFLSLIVLLLSIVALSVNAGDTFFPPTKYRRSPIAKTDYHAIIEKARGILEKEQLFKKESLTIGELAKQLQTNPKYLSQAINDYLKISFADFINEYRVEAAKTLLLEEAYQSLTIEAIGELAGFKSKSSFFRAFKKFTQLTPNQYLKSASKGTK